MPETLLDRLRQIDPSLGDLADRIRPLTQALGVDGATQTDETEGTQRWRHWSSSTDVAALTRLQFDPATGRFSDPGPGSGSGPAERSTGGLLSFPSTRIDWRLAAAYVGDPNAPAYDGRFRLHLVLPSAVLRVPFLRGARPDGRGILVPDPDHPQVTFTLPRIGVGIKRETIGGQVDVRLESATVTGAPTEDVYAFCRMDPAYALIGPGTIAGFAFRTAVLDLSETSAPPEARGVPPEWQGLWLPEARIYVAPEGMEDIACSGGVRDLFIGIGLHAGVTGTFDVEVLRRGSAPQIRMRLHDAQGRWYDVPDGADGSTVMARAPATATLVVEADGGLAPRTASITVGTGSAESRWTKDINVPGSGSVRLRVQVASAAGATGPAPTATRTVEIARVAAPGGSGPGGGPAPPATASTTSAGPARIIVVSQAGNNVTLGVEPAGANPTWTVEGGTPTTATTLTVAIPQGTQRQVSATRARTSTTPLAAYWPFDHPEAGEDRLTETPPRAPYSQATAHDKAALDRAGAQWSTGARLLRETLAARLASLSPGTGLTVTGYASFEPNSTAPADYNRRLSLRRAQALKAMIDEAKPGLNVAASGAGHARHQANLSQPASDYWHAELNESVPDAGNETITGTVSRGSANTPVTQRPPPTTPPPEPGHASWFRRIRVELELHRSRFVRLEITGEIDLVTATERAGHRLQPNPGNPMDGVTAFSARITVDDATGSWTAAVAVRAAEGDRDGLWQVDRAAANATAVDIAGVFAGLGPLLAAATPPSPSAGDLVPLVLGSALLTAAAAIIHSSRVTLRGGQVRVASVAGRTEVAVLLDIETKLFADFGVVAIPENKAITTRYRALGLGVGHTAGGSVESPRVLFDPAAGYTLDIPAGAVVSRGPLGDILRVLGARVSRDNPTYLEADIGLGADLGVVTVERARVRVRIDQLGELPSLTGLTASVDIPGTFRGRGSLDIRDDRLSGALDITLVPLHIRASARVTVISRPEVLGVLIGAEVNLPAPIPLGNSGLAILGFIGGIGVNMRRVEPTGTRTPALDWLAAQPGRDPLDGAGWGARAGSWAIAAGAILGTTEGGFLFHLKGLVVLELPGPRLLFMAKANVLTMPPGLRTTAEAQFLAVVDINPAGISAALVAEYDIVELIHVRVPVTAAFDFNVPSNWHIDLGRFDDPISVEIFTMFRGSGYLMIHGNGITIPGLPALPATGFAIAVGLRVTFIWGSEAIGLYLRVGAGFDAVLSFQPVGLTGQISIEGELRLFIVSIGANARLDVKSAPRDGDLVPSTWIHGQVCGEVDFWLFSVSGCVDFELGSDFTAAMPPEPLVSDVILVSRAPAHVEGSATAGPVDGVLARAKEDGSTDPAAEPVPLDALPVVMFSTAVTPAGGFTAGHPGGPDFAVANVPITHHRPWVRRGDRWWRYEVLSVTLDGPLGAGPLPATWWTMPGGREPAAGAALALLSWVPEPTPRAVIYGERLEQTVRRTWAGICDPPAKPVPFLWHWNDTPRGPSADGWELAGVPGPDDSGTARTTPARATIQVSEPWRCGEETADLRRGIDVARVVGGAVSCPEPQGEGPAAGNVSSLDAPDSIGTLAGLVQAGIPIRAMADAQSNFRRDFDRGGCRGHVLRSPGDDGREPSRFGDPVAAAAIEKAWGQTGFQQPALIDAVRLAAAGEDGFERLDLLLLVPSRALKPGFSVRSLDSDGSELHRQDLSGAQVIDGWFDLPERWRDADGPWHDPAWLGMGGALAMTSHTEDWRLVLVSANLPQECPVVEVGWDPDALDSDEPAPGVLPAFYLVLAEGATTAESRRFGWDRTVSSGRRTAISNALTKEEDDHALLVPGANYAVSVRWQAYSARQDADPGGATGTATGAAVTQTFRFPASKTPPVSLEPWIIATTPGAEEPAVLCDATVRLAQATDGVARLFAAYGERLEVVVRAASGRHPQPGGTRAGAGPLTPHALGTAASAAGGLGGAPAMRLLSPWEEAVRALAFSGPTGPCPPPGSRVGHTTEEIRYPFEPCTEHLFDVEAVSAAGRRLVLRRGFTTSRYRSAAELADALSGVRVRHRAADAAPLHALASAPTGPALEAAFVAAGLPRPVVPDQPMVTVCWSRGGVPQPVAVLIEAPEAIVHTRHTPVREPLNDPRAQAGWIWAGRNRTVFEPVMTGGAGVTVGRTITAPGMDRQVILLNAGARGGTVTVELRQAADPLAGVPENSTPVLTLVLARAPWEDDGLG